MRHVVRGYRWRSVHGRRGLAAVHAVLNAGLGRSEGCVPLTVILVSATIPEQSVMDVLKDPSGIPFDLVEATIIQL